MHDLTKIDFRKISLVNIFVRSALAIHDAFNGSDTVPIIDMYCTDAYNDIITFVRTDNVHYTSYY